MKKLQGTVSHRELVIEELRADPKLARAYLLVAMEDDDPRVFLTALRNVADPTVGLDELDLERGALGRVHARETDGFACAHVPPGGVRSSAGSAESVHWNQSRECRPRVEPRQRGGQ